MPYSSSIGASGGAKRSGRWFVLVFLCMALILALVPAVSLGWGVPQAKVTLSTNKGCVDYGGSVKLIGSRKFVPSRRDVHAAGQGFVGHLGDRGHRRQPRVAGDVHEAVADAQHLLPRAAHVAQATRRQATR